MIPKIIHYCWFGNGTLSEKELKCIESWKRFCPDYEIMLWNESNYDIKKNKYMYEAYTAHKWGFVPDYARLDIIYNYGGIYLDTDVEIIRSLDSLLENDAFMGFESGKYINPGLGFGAVPHHNTIKMLLSIYDNISFTKPDGNLNLTPSPIMNTNFLVQHGAIMNDVKQAVLGITLYPSEYFCPLDYVTGIETTTKNTYSIHRFSMSWIDPVLKKWYLRQQKLARIIGETRAHIIIRFLNFPDRVMIKFKSLGLKKTILFILSKIKNTGGN